MTGRQIIALLLVVCLGLVCPGRGAAAGLEKSEPFYTKKESWVETLLATRAALMQASLSAEDRHAASGRAWDQFEADFPVPWDWILQDAGTTFPRWLEKDDGPVIEQQMITRVLSDLGGEGAGVRREMETLLEAGASSRDPHWLALYGHACEQRRSERLTTVLSRMPRIVFTKHPTIRPSFFAYTEGQSDAQNERHFLPGARLCLLEMNGLMGQVRTLLDDPAGAIRDPAVSYDGRHILFAWKKSLDGDDYHLYEMDAVSGATRPVTSGAGFADYEPSYLPNGDIVFSSTRCVQTVDCWWTEVSNLYTCGPDGRFLRRLGFDQVHTVFPTVTDDGRVIYTRWDYNDRGQVFPQPLFQMNADGTGQTEFYGNNSWFPTTIAHARGIPGTQRVLAILCGHHTTQAGKLAIIDPAQGRQENQGVQLIAPVRETKADRIDAYGQTGELFQYPCPLTESEFLVTYAPLGWEYQGQKLRRKGDAHFGVYWMDKQGRRELLASDAQVACQQPVPLAARPRPPVRPNTVDYRRETGTYYVQDVHAGPGLAGVPRGTVKKLRVVALGFRPAGVGNNGSGGPGGGALISTPIAIGNGSWDVKIVLGEARVYDDGSAFFTVPARTPVYFQAIDERGHVAQTMRSWSTLQPGENQACAGCHEPKNTAPPAMSYNATLALRAGAQTLDPFYGPARGFSFPKEIQPILDRHCVSCHKDRDLKMEPERLKSLVTRDRDPVWNYSSPSSAFRRPAKAVATNQLVFSLLGDGVVDHLAKRQWSDAYLNLTQAEPDRDDWARGSFRGLYDGRVVNWIGSQSIPAPLPPYAAGACRSELVPLLENGHGGAKLSREEMDKIACWIDLFVPYCGDYTEVNTWTEADKEKYQHYLEKRTRMELIERRNLDELIADQAAASPRAQR